MSEDTDADCAGTNGGSCGGANGTTSCDSASKQTASAPEQTAAERWDAVGRDLLWLRIGTERGQLNDALYPLQKAVEEDRAIDETAVREARAQLDQMRAFLEDYVVPLADGDIEPWDEAPGGGHVPHRAYIEKVENTGRYAVHKLPPEQRNSADAGTRDDE